MKRLFILMVIIFAALSTALSVDPTRKAIIEQDVETGEVTVDCSNPGSSCTIDKE